MSTVRADGITLQPDRPATIADAALVQAIAKGGLANVRTTYTSFDNYTFHYVLSVGLGDAFTMPVAGLGPLGAATQYALFDYFALGTPAAVVPVTGTFTVPAGQGQPDAPANAHAIQYWTLVPQLPGGYWLVGEKGKVVPMSKQRVTALTPLEDGFYATVLTPSSQEAVTFLIAPASGVVAEVICAFNPAGAATLQCSMSACSCK